MANATIRFQVTPTARKNLEEAAAKFLEAAGQQIVNQAREHVPIRTGNLWRSIAYEVYEGADGDPMLFVWAGNEQVNYAKYVEDGTSRMRAQPYLRPAIYECRARLKWVAP